MSRRVRWLIGRARQRRRGARPRAIRARFSTFVIIARHSLRRHTSLSGWCAWGRRRRGPSPRPPLRWVLVSAVRRFAGGYETDGLPRPAGAHSRPAEGSAKKSWYVLECYLATGPSSRKWHQGCPYGDQTQSHPGHGEISALRPAPSPDRMAAAHVKRCDLGNSLCRSLQPNFLTNPRTPRVWHPDRRVESLSARKGPCDRPRPS